MTTNRKTTNHRTARMVTTFRPVDSKLTRESSRIAHERSIVDKTNLRCRTPLLDSKATKADPADRYMGAKTSHYTPNARG